MLYLHISSFNPHNNPVGRYYYHLQDPICCRDRLSGELVGWLSGVPLQQLLLHQHCFVSTECQIVSGGWFRSFQGLEKQNQFTACRGNNFVVPPEKREETIIISWFFKPEILRREISGDEALFSPLDLPWYKAHFCLLWPPSVDAVHKCPFLHSLVFLSSRVHLLRVRFLANSQSISSPGMTPAFLAH